VRRQEFFLRPHATTSDPFDAQLLPTDLDQDPFQGSEEQQQDERETLSSQFLADPAQPKGLSVKPCSNHPSGPHSAHLLRQIFENVAVLMRPKPALQLQAVVPASDFASLSATAHQ
jgi:hypothetical protein